MADRVSHQQRALLRARAAQDRLTARLAAALRRYFSGLASNAVARFLIGGSVIVPDDDTAALVRVLGPHLIAASNAASTSAGALLGQSYQPDDPEHLKLVLQRVASRARMMTEETRRAVRETIAEGVGRGYGPRAIAAGMPADGFRGLRDVVEETYRGRALTIARTETAIVWQETAHSRYARAGVTHVRIHDGAGCGWTRHDDADKADGSIRTLADAEAHPIAHPNCRRASAPIIGRVPA